MSDQRLRRFERCAAQGDPVERARWLRERLRSGDLDVADLTLAAYLDDAGAALAADGPAPPSELRSWVKGLSRFGGARLAVAAGLAAAAAVESWWLRTFPEDGRPRAAMTAAAIWCALPAPARAQEAQRAARRAWAAADRALGTEHPDLAACAESAARAAEAAGAPPHLAWLHARGAATRAVASGRMSEGEVRAAIRTALLPERLRDDGLGAR